MLAAQPNRLYVCTYIQGAYVALEMVSTGLIVFASYESKEKRGDLSQTLI
jgi:hypothetical protein